MQHGINWREENATDVEATESWFGPPRKVRFYNLAGGADIVKGDAVAWVPGDTTYGFLFTGEQLDVSDAAFPLIMGGAETAVADGEEGFLIVRGIQENVNVVDGTAVGARLSGGAADGRLAATANDYFCAVLLTAPSSNLATVWWVNPLNL